MGTQKKMGKKPNYPQRKSKDPEYYNYNSPYYTPLYGTKDCNYTGKKRGRKTLFFFKTKKCQENY